MATVLEALHQRFVGTTAWSRILDEGMIFNDGRYSQSIPSGSFVPPQEVTWRSFYTSTGAPSTLYWTHGLGVSGLTERAFAREMVLRGHDVVMPDLPGCGRSDWLVNQHGLPLGNRDLKGHLIDLRELVIDGLARFIIDDAQKRKGPVVLGGNSMGGSLTKMVASRLQESIIADRLAGVLTACSFASDGDVIDPHPYISAVGMAGNPHESERIPLALVLLFEMLMTLGAVYYFSSSHVSLDEIMELMQRSMWTHWPVEAEGRNRAWLATRAVAQTVYAQVVKAGLKNREDMRRQRQLQGELRLPIVTVYGEHDPLFSDRVWNAHATIPRSIALVARHHAGRGRSGLGHLVEQQHPAALADLFSGVMDYWTQHPGECDPPINLAGFENRGVSVRRHVAQR